MLEILQATVADATEILALQKLAYLSEAKLYNDNTIPPLTQTIEELIADFDAPGGYDVRSPRGGSLVP